MVRLTRHLKRESTSGKELPQSLSRAAYQPRRLAQRLPNEEIAAILAAYDAGATTREVGEQFGLAHSSINKLLKRHGVTARRRGLSPNEVQRAIELYSAGLSTRVIGEHLGFGASTVLRALAKAGLQRRSQRNTDK